MANESLQFDAIIIGSGQGGNPLAASLAAKGERVALIESNQLGGTCVNTGCTPTKTLVASAQVAHYARDGARWGVNTTGVGVDMRAVLERKRKVVESSRSSWEKKVNGPEEPKLIRGRAHFSGAHQVQVNGQTLAGRRIFINTGAEPTIPRLQGLENIPYLTNESILELDFVPQHLIVLGGGYVGLEFAQIFRRFGSNVTLVHAGKQLLPKEDEDVSTSLQQALESEGVQFILRGRASEVAGQSGSLQVTVDVESGSSTTVTGSHLLVAVGRTPRTRALNLAAAGVKTDEKGYVLVNDRLETSAPDIWALGDVKGGPAFTHISYNDYQVIYGNLYGGKQLSIKNRLVPYAVYTDPTLGRVGMTEEQARAAGHKLKIGKVEMTHVARAIERGETAGFMKLVVDAETDKVLGAAILSVEGAELVQIISTLMLADKPYTLLKGAIYIHPTLAEGFFAWMDSVQPVD